jgi:putative spermidine/putrescine transport system substrate-binding protein
MRTSATELRVLGTKEQLLESIRERAESDLGIRVHYTALDGMNALQRAILNPESFDVYDQWHTSDLAWTARAIQPIAIDRIVRWEEIGTLSLTGRFDSWSKGAQGDAPGRKLWSQANGTLGSTPSGYVSMVPTVYNADSPGFLPEARQLIDPSEPESWSWLLDERLRGRVAIMADPSLGVIECAMAAQAAGLATFSDLGNLTITEIDILIDILMKKKKSQHFAGFWSTFEDAVQLVEREDVLVQSIWSPAVTALRARGWEMAVSHPVEGSRGWHSGLCLSSRADPKVMDAAYAYFNWWLEGWAGAQLARRGYYMSVPERTRAHLSDAEWCYWYLGLPARENILDNEGGVVARAGQKRDGGSYRDRLSRIAVWNSFMDEHNYLVRRWNEFLAS